MGTGAASSSLLVLFAFPSADEPAGASWRFITISCRKKHDDGQVRNHDVAGREVSQEMTITSYNNDNTLLPRNLHPRHTKV
jgi:hypothetical protein